MRCNVFVFSLVVVPVATWICAFPAEELLADPFYGNSHATHKFTCFIVGFFLWDTAHTISNFDSFLFVAHAITCLAVYTFGLYPFVQLYACYFICFEASTPFLTLRGLMIDFACTNKLLIKINQLFFAATFIVVRLLIGIPLSVCFWSDMVILLRSGNQHSTAIVMCMLFFNGLLNSLNLFWGWKIISKLSTSFAAELRARRHVSTSEMYVEFANIVTILLCPLAQTVVLVFFSRQITSRALTINLAAWFQIAFSTVYHFRCLLGVDADHIDNSFRRADQTAIHFVSCVWGGAFADSHTYRFLLVVYHLPCILALWRPDSHGKWMRARIAGGVVGYLVPLCYHGQAVAFIAACVTFLLACVPLVFSQTIRGWGHPLFHVGLIAFGIIIQAAALQYE